MIFDYVTLKVIWWCFVGVLLIGFALTNGFDFGVGMWLPFLGKSDIERRVIINVVGPTWEGNQTWFIAAGGAMFAAWPLVYAAAFSGFYIALMLLLFALFLRPVGFDYRSKLADARWRSAWDWGLFVGGAVPPLIFGVAFGNLLQGVPFHYDDTMRMAPAISRPAQPFVLTGCWEWRCWLCTAPRCSKDRRRHAERAPRRHRPARNLWRASRWPACGSPPAWKATVSRRAAAGWPSADRENRVRCRPGWTTTALAGHAAFPAMAWAARHSRCVQPAAQLGARPAASRWPASCHAGAAMFLHHASSLAPQQPDRVGRGGQPQSLAVMFWVVAIMRRS